MQTKEPKRVQTCRQTNANEHERISIPTSSASHTSPSPKSLRQFTYPPSSLLHPTGSGLDEQRGMGEASGDDEFRPFIRHLPEWQFWYVFLSFPHSVPHPSTNTLTLTTQQQALLNTCNDNSTPMHHLRDLQCTSLLAHSRLLFRRFVRFNYEEANSVRPDVCFSYMTQC